MGVFVLASLVLIVMPGPDQAMVTRNTLVGNRTTGLLTVLGGTLGLSVHATAAAVGVSALLIASATAFMVLKVVGTGYLIWMGVQTLRGAARTAAGTAEAVPDRRVSRFGAVRYVRHGFLSNSLNPKVALFFVTFLPQFLSPGSTAAHALLLSAVFAVVYVTWFSGYVLLVDLFGSVLRRPRVMAWIERATGGLLIAFGIRLALDT